MLPQNLKSIGTELPSKNPFEITFRVIPDAVVHLTAGRAMVKMVDSKKNVVNVSMLETYEWDLLCGFQLKTQHTDPPVQLKYAPWSA